MSELAVGADKGCVLVKNEAGRFLFLPEERAKYLLEKASKAARIADRKCDFRIVKESDKDFKDGSEEALGKDYDTKKGEWK